MGGGAGGGKPKGGREVSCRSQTPKACPTHLASGLCGVVVCAVVLQVEDLITMRCSNSVVMAHGGSGTGKSYTIQAGGAVRFSVAVRVHAGRRNVIIG